MADETVRALISTTLGLMKSASAIALIAALLAASVAAGEFPLPCHFLRDEPDFGEVSNCAEKREDRVVFSKAALKNASFSKNGLARAWIDRTWYYIKRNGTTLPVITYEMGADYFFEGLVRSRVNDKIAYFDREFQQVIPPKYDWGWPFKNGRAMVCAGCKESASDNEGHHTMEGGRWGYIDHNGREVVSVTHSRDEIMKAAK